MTETWDRAAVLARLAALQRRQELWRTHDVITLASASGHARLSGVPPIRADKADPGGEGPVAGQEVLPSLAAALTMRAVLGVLHDHRLDLPFDHNVHAAQSLAWHAAVTVGASIETRAWIGRIREATRAVFFDVETESVTEDGRTCLRGTSTQALRHG
ncbi:hypothetical protein [Polymorphospora rubra]|uniref:Uncharacterized protein n=1 Tax=Polymorphospora rubra TaxID=338584 RepID=A0A810N655_9ACTN|nr:hypothetical protein [Polymorphospora rubra]BCJ67994.1 hypothetical protein Prubr_50150 [Polymorphospora rubra]